jgi:hypothetical protein
VTDASDSGGDIPVVHIGGHGGGGAGAGWPGNKSLGGTGGRSGHGGGGAGPGWPGTKGSGGAGHPGSDSGI